MEDVTKTLKKFLPNDSKLTDNDILENLEETAGSLNILNLN